MPQQPEHLEHQHVEETKDPGAPAFMLAAGVLMIAEIAFGVLNGFRIIHM